MRKVWITLCLIVSCGACVDAGEAGIVELDGSEPNKRAAIDLLPYFKFLSAELTWGDPIRGPDGVVPDLKLIGWDGEQWQWSMARINGVPVMNTMVFHVDQLPNGLEKVTGLPGFPEFMTGPASQMSTTWIVQKTPSGDLELVDYLFAGVHLVCNASALRDLGEAD